MRTLQKLGWHNTQVMPDLKPSMEDSTLHADSVVAVVSEHHGENHFSLNQNLIAQPDHGCTVMKSGDWEESLLLMSILPVLLFTMTEYGYLANPTIAKGVRSRRK